MLKRKVAVLVSGGGTNLQALIDAQNDGRISDGEITLVVSNKSDAYALTRAKENGIESLFIQKDKDFENNLITALAAHQIDLIVLAGFLVILSEDFVRRFAGRIINIHPSLIPSFCGDGFYGLKVHKAALARGVKVTGATVHFVNEITDGGEIILQKAVAVEEGDTPETLQKRVMQQAEWVILPQAVQKVCSEWNKACDSQGKEMKQ